MPKNQKDKIIDLRDQHPGNNIDDVRSISSEADVVDLRGAKASVFVPVKEIKSEVEEPIQSEDPIQNKQPIQSEQGEFDDISFEPYDPDEAAREILGTKKGIDETSEVADMVESSMVAEGKTAEYEVEEIQPTSETTSLRQSWRERFNFLQLAPAIVWRKSLVLFILACVFSVTTIRGFAFFQGDLLDKKDRILADAHVAYQYMDSGSRSVVDKDYDLASYKFSVASQRFVSAQNELNILGDKTAEILAVLPGGAQVSAADNLLAAGSDMAIASQYVAKGLAPFQKAPDITDSLTGKEETSAEEELDISFTEALLIANNNLTQVLEKTKSAERHMDAVSVSALPDDIAGQVQEVQAMMPQVNQALGQWLSYSEVMLEMLGHDNPRKYLFVFQNSRELRATGGFIGTYGLFDVNEGKIKSTKMEGPYNIDGQLLDKITSPEAMRLIAPRFYMRDANWFADFSDSAQKVADLYEKSGGATVDGVVSVNSNFARDLISLTGPIDMPEYGVTISADNFYEQIQQKVEFDYDKEENKPKKILSDLFPKLMTNFSKIDKEKWPQVMTMFFKALEKKDIMFYFSDEELEGLVSDFGWAGKLSQTDQDYLNVVSTNVGGGKTDHIMHQDINLDVDIRADGSVVNTLEIKRSHKGKADDMWEGVKNVSYMRVYVPQGSQLISAEGFDDWFFQAVLDPVEGSEADPAVASVEKYQEIDEASQTRISKESGKTVFGNWLGIEPEEEKTVKIKYKLPFKVRISEQDFITSYSLVLQRQPGSENRHFTGQIDALDAWQPIWKYAIEGKVTDDLRYETELDKDKVIGVIFSDEED